jgi:hypothetical protein
MRLRHNSNVSRIMLWHGVLDPGSCVRRDVISWPARSAGSGWRRLRLLRLDLTLFSLGVDEIHGTGGLRELCWVGLS